MTIQTVQGISFKSQNKRNENVILPAGGTIAGAVLGGAVIGQKITPKFILKNDKFNLSEKIKNKTLTEEEKEAVKIIEEAKAESKKVDKQVEESVGKFFGKSLDEVPAENILGKSPEKFKEEIIEKAQEGVKKLQQDAINVEESVKKATGGVASISDETLKSTAKEEKEVKETLFKLLNKKINNCAEEIGQNQAKLDLVKDGKIKKVDYKAHVEGVIKTKTIRTIKEALETLKGKLSRIPSFKTAAIGAALGLGIGLILPKMFVPKSSGNGA